MLPYVITARDSSTSPPGQPVTGLKPTWVFLKRLDNGKDVSQPPIAEIEGGQYVTRLDPEFHGDCSGQIDLGPTVPWPSDRYVDLVFLASDSRTARTSFAVTLAPGPAGLILGLGPG